MFNGIIRQQGKGKLVRENDRVFLDVFCEVLPTRIYEGQSVAIDGVCLSVISKNERHSSLRFELMPETLSKTRFGKPLGYDQMNIEFPLRMGDTVDGHWVLGHVDATAGVKKVISDGSKYSLTIAPPLELFKYFPEKGSVAVNGVSLTISKADQDQFQVSLIPLTLRKTNLSLLRETDLVNIEVDVLCRYLGNLI
ncbi:MAG: riboflavin synthase [Parcubacteria group bacterium]|nr:riboflavin synthase [Parcubacteria group bacterium]